MPYSARAAVTFGQSMLYDSSGNVVFSLRNNTLSSVVTIEERRSFSAANELLRAANHCTPVRKRRYRCEDGIQAEPPLADEVGESMRARGRARKTGTAFDFQSHGRSDRTSSDLIVGREYIVMGIGFWEGTVWLEVETEGGFLMSVPLQEFDELLGSPSAFWQPRVDPDGSLRLWPMSFYRHGYQSDLADLDEDTVRDFREVRERLVHEDRSQLLRGW